MPHDSVKPRPSKPYSEPMKTPERTDCARSVALGSVIARKAVASSGFLAQLELGTRLGDFLRPDDDPGAVLHLLDPHQVVAVIVRPVEAQCSLDRRDLVLLD